MYIKINGLENYTAHFKIKKTTKHNFGSSKIYKLSDRVYFN